MVSRPVLFSLCALFVLQGACSGNAVNAADPTGSGAGGAGAQGATGSGASGGETTGAGGVGGDVTTFESSMGPLTIDPGDERTQCIVRRLGNPDAAFVRRFRATLTPASHHMIVYRSSKTEEELTPKNCQGFSGLLSGEHPIFIAQQADATLLFPMDGDRPVGLRIEPNQMLRIEMHYINATGAPIDATGTAYVDTVPITDDVVESDLAFWGTTQISIPPNGAGDTGVKFQKALPDTRTFALTTHQHHFGTRMRVWQTTSASDVSSEPVADSTNWSDPPLEMFDPALEFPGGSGLGFAYRCEWQNTSSSPIGFGEGFNDEMCFLWHYYYPSQGFHICADGFCM